jgi:hypothetical protein
MRTVLTITRARVAILAATLFALAGLAYAQSLGDAAIGIGHLELVALIAGAVAWLRATPLGKTIDGPITVPLFAMVVGLAVGAGAEILGLLTANPFDVLAAPWSGAAFGFIAAIEAVFGVSIVKYVAGVFRRGDDGKVTVDTSKILNAAGEIATEAGASATPVAFALDFAARLLGREPIGAALTALYPVIVQYAQHPAVLTDDLRARIQAQVLDALSSAGLVGQDLE